MRAVQSVGVTTSGCRQLQLPFPPLRENRKDRCRRILTGVPPVKCADNHRFDYEMATRQAALRLPLPEQK